MTRMAAAAAVVRTGLVAAGHAALATVAVAGVDALLVRSARTMAGGAAALVQASGVVALLWAYVGLLLGLSVGARGFRQRNAGRGAGPNRARSAGPNRPRNAGPHRPRNAEPNVGNHPGQTAGPERTSASRPTNPRPRPRARSWRQVLLTWHRQIDVMVVALTLLHALVYALAAPGGTLLVALVPGTAPVQTLGFNLGVLGLYLTAVLGPSYYLRDRIGRRLWLVAHQLAAVSYAMSLWHALALGSTLRLEGIPRALTWLLQIPLLILIALRLLRPRRAADQLRVSVRGQRYAGWRHSLLRTSMAWGLLITAVIVLFMALLAAEPGLVASS